jgi:glycerophosphoryl diester phosphodiesterase
MTAPHPPTLPRVIGHRGAAGHAPENTLASIRKAAALGATWVEVDVMLSGDGAPVLIHDETLERTTDGKGHVSETALAELRTRDAGSWFGTAFAGERIPSLAEAAALVAELGLGINIEIKPAAGFERGTGRAVGAFAVRDWPPGLLTPLLSSFSPDALAAAREAAPGLPRALLVGRIPKDWQERLEDLGCALLHCAERHLTAATAEAVLDAGYHLLAYTVNERARGTELYSWGVEAVFSDYPDRFLNM